MDKKNRKELLEEYKQHKTYMGVLQITNNTNGKIYVAANPNLKNRWLNIQSQLEMGRHPDMTTVQVEPSERMALHLSKCSSD